MRTTPLICALPTCTHTRTFCLQIHLWRWTGNSSHGALLFPALKLHAEWAHDCFDADSNFLYSSFTNTWPTDSQFYSGGETFEMTAYMYRVHIAIRDLALAADNASEAAAFNASAASIRHAAGSLWVTDLGLPASHREEGGHRRLRPDPWLYSIFLPIEAGLWEPDTAAQALHFSEHGLQRDEVPCTCSSDPCNSTTGGSCGSVVWTSNWVPSMWSVRQLWSGVSGDGLCSLATFFFSRAFGDPNPPPHPTPSFCLNKCRIIMASR